VELNRRKPFFYSKVDVLREEANRSKCSKVATAAYIHAHVNSGVISCVK